MDASWVSILPPLLAIVLAIVTREVFVSLFAGIFLGWTILSGWNPLLGLTRSLDGCVGVFRDGGNTKVILFSALVGALLALTQRSGGVKGFVDLVTNRGWIKGRKSAQLMAAGMGCLIFIESSITSLITGSVSRPIFDRLKISREKLAYICDSTSAPICILIPLNAWGAYTLQLLSKEKVQDPFSVFLYGIPFNFYAISAVLLVFALILTSKDFGPMKEAERRALEEGKPHADDAQPMVSDEILQMEAVSTDKAKAINLILPVLTMIIMMPLGLFITGKGSMTAGSGSTSVFWAILAAIAVAMVMYLAQGLFSFREMTDLALKGIGGLMPLAILMVLAFAIGDVARQLKTGLYVASVAKTFLSPAFVPFVLFVVSCFIAFSTGTSWGTFAIMIPIAIPVATSADINLSLVLSAVLGGGVFGDHCSPISDTTMVASMAAASDHVDHIRTQLPYALSAASIASLLYLGCGFIL